MTDPVAEEVIAEAFRKLGSHYVLGAEGPTVFDCSGLIDWIFNQTGHGALVGTSRKLAAGYARYFADNGKFSRSFSDAQRGDLICYSHNGTHVSHIGIYLGNGEAISALIEPYHVSKHVWNHIEVPFYGVCLVDYPSDTGRIGPDDTDSQDDDPEVDAYWSPTGPRDIQILYQGVDITADVKFDQAEFTTQSGPDAGQAFLRVRDTPHLYPRGYFHAGGTLELIIDGRREWDGWVMTVDRQWTFDAEDTNDLARITHWWRLTGFDRNLLFARRVHLDKANPVNTMFGTYPAGAIDQDVVRDILENYTTLEEDGLDLESGIMPVGPIDPYVPVKAVSAGQSLGSSMVGISAMNGALVYIDPDRIFRYVDDQTNTAVFALSDRPVAGVVGYRDMTIEEDGNQLYNDALIWGVGMGSPDPVFARVESEDSEAVHGRFQFGGLEQGMYKQLSVERRADTLVNGSPAHNRGHKDDAVRIRCTIFEPGLRVGDGVSFEAQAWDFGDLTFDPGDVVYTPGNFDKNTEFERLLAQIGKIESNNTYTRQNKRSYAYGQWQIMPGNWRVWGPLALGLPRSVGVASRDIDPMSWFPVPTPENQDRVVRWRMGALYQHKGQDPRRVAASWKGGASVGSREPSTWSRGVLFYVNHACMPLGYPETTNATVLEPISEPDIDRGDFQPPTNSDDVYPVRKVTIDFPTPTAVRYRLMMSHEYDTAWAYRDPIPPISPPGTPPPGGYTEIIDLYVPPDFGGTGDDPSEQPDESLIGTIFSVGCRGWATRGVYGHNEFIFPNEQWVQDGADSGSDQITFLENAPGIHSSIGYPLQNILETVPMNPCGDDAWTNWEDSEQWYGPVSASLAEANRQWPLEIRVAGSPQLVSGYVPSVLIGVAHHGPEDDQSSGSSSYGTSAHIGECVNIGDSNSIVYPSDWRTRYGQPLYEAEFSTFLMPIGSLLEGDWITVSPGWQCQRMVFPAFFCDTSAEAFWGTDPIADAANNRGPIVSGMGASGRFSGTGPFQAIDLTVVGWTPSSNPPSSSPGTPTPGHDNEPPSVGPGVGGTNNTYRTTYPYIAGTLEVTWQGTKLTRGVDYTETDPAGGLFTINQVQSGETQIVITYKIPVGAGPTNPLPGEPGGPGDGTSNDDAIEAVIAQAWSWIGTYYQHAEGYNGDGIDCSGLIYRIFKDAGYGSLVGTGRKLAAGYTRYFADLGKFTRNLSYARRGDLIVYSENGVHVSHIGIYLGDGRVISALINPFGVTAHRTLGIHVSFYGVLMVPYPSDSSRSSTDTSDADPSDPEVEHDPSEDPPPQVPTPSTGKIYRPRPQSQFGWGTEWDGQNCNMAAAAMALDRHTLGAYSDVRGTPRSTAPQMRFYSGRTGPDSFTRAGTTLTDAQTAWSAGWDQELLLPGPVSWTYFVSQIRDGRGAILHGRETALPDAYRRSNWEDAHAIFVNEVLADGSFWVCDPLGQQATLFPEAVLMAYAQSLFNADVITCAFTRRTPQS